MSVSITLEGLREFVRELGAVPAHVERAAGQVIDDAAGRLAQQLRADLPQVTGELAGSVQYRRALTEPLLATVWYGQPDGRELDWANAFEKGSPPRTTQAGAGRGRAPKRKAMARRAGAARRAMNRRLAQVLTEELRKL